MESGQRDLALVVGGPDVDVVSDVAATSSARHGRDSASGLGDVDGPAEPDRNPHSSRSPACSGRPRRVDRRHRGDGARRHDRRHRAEPREIQRQRPPDSNPRATCPTARVVHRVASGKPEGAGEEQYRRAACGRRRHRTRSGAGRDRSLRPRRSRRRRSQYGRLRRVGFADRASDGHADREEPAARRDDPPDRRRRDHAGGVLRLPAGDGGGHHDGLCRFGASLRLVSATADDSVFAAALDRRCHPRASHISECRSRCPW